MTIQIEPNETPTGCPFHTTSERKTNTVQPAPPISRDESGTWQIHGFVEARALLRNEATRQAGFRAELLDRASATMKRPILYQEGQPHHEQRRQTARFFTPRFTSENYRGLMEQLADEVIADLRRTGQADLSALSLCMAVAVAAQVVGLTDSRKPGMDRRLDAFFGNEPEPKRGSFSAIMHQLRSQSRLLWFYLMDVRPAIQARRKQPREDVISHLLERDYNDLGVLTECITYGAAGMATTREFIAVAAWHMIEQPELRQRFLTGADDERRGILEEILRVEPVVGVLHRRATADLTIESEGQSFTIREGERVAVDVYAANADERLVGDTPGAVCPGRSMTDERAPSVVMSFGDGHHRCPGAYVALQETEIFLLRLLAIESLQIVRPPNMRRTSLAESYELRDFVVTV